MRRLTAILFFVTLGFSVFALKNRTQAAIAPPPIPSTPKPSATPFQYPNPKTCYRCNVGGWCEAYTDTSPASSCSTGCGGCQTPSSAGGSSSGGGAPTPVPTPTAVPCSGSCYILACTYTGRLSASGSCSFGQNCCGTGQIVKVCSVAGDICGTRTGARCCTGYTCSDPGFGHCVAGNETQTDIIPYPAVGCLHDGDCATNNTLCHIVNGALVPDGGACKPGTSPGSALTSGGAQCSLANGVCISARSCASVGLLAVNGGSGCDTASAVCCSRSQTTELLNNLTSTPPPNVAGSLCVPDSIPVVQGVKCCANTSYTFNNVSYCGVKPNNIYEIIPGQICDPYYGGGSGVCSCGGKIVGVGRMCLIGFDGIVRKDTNGGYDVYVCDKNGTSCSWININNVNDPSFKTAFQKALLSDPQKYLGFLSSSADLQGTYINLCDSSGKQTGSIQLGLGAGADPRNIANLISSGQVCQNSLNEIFGYADKQYNAQSQLDVVFGNSNLTQDQVDLIKEAQIKATDPISVQFERLSLQTLSSGLQSWIQKTEAIINDPNLPIWQKYLLWQYQSTDLITLGLFSSTKDAAVAWAQCNALANAGLKPEGCGAETITAGIQGTFLADFVTAPFGVTQGAVKQLDNFFTALAKGDKEGALSALSQIPTSIRNLFGPQDWTVGVILSDPARYQLQVVKDNLVVYLDTTMLGGQQASYYAVDQSTGRVFSYQLPTSLNSKVAAEIIAGLPKNGTTAEIADYLANEINKYLPYDTTYSQVRDLINSGTIAYPPDTAGNFDAACEIGFGVCRNRAPAYVSLLNEATGTNDFVMIQIPTTDPNISHLLAFNTKTAYFWDIPADSSIAGSVSGIAPSGYDFTQTRIVLPTVDHKLTFVEYLQLEYPTTWEQVAMAYEKAGYKVR